MTMIFVGAPRSGALASAKAERRIWMRRLRRIARRWRSGTRERVPLDWAATQNNLGTALSALGERESGTAQLEAAVAAYRAALEEWNYERVPLDWATAQNNLGNALRKLGKRESGTAHLDEAVAAYRAALEERTRERAPLQWARCVGNQGVALILLAERQNDAMGAKEAIWQISIAEAITSDSGDAPAARYFKAQLTKAFILVRRLECALRLGALASPYQ